jgi:hypothetical protein
VIKHIPIQEALPEVFFEQVAAWPLSSELPEGATQDALLDQWIALARQLELRERDLHKRSRD